MISAMWMKWDNLSAYQNVDYPDCCVRYHGFYSSFFSVCICSIVHQWIYTCYAQVRLVLCQNEYSSSISQLARKADFSLKKIIFSGSLDCRIFPISHLPLLSSSIRILNEYSPGGVSLKVH